MKKAKFTGTIIYNKRNVKNAHKRGKIMVN